jgi:hypothetical protein
MQGRLKEAGVSLVEVMIASAIIGIGILGAISAFKYIALSTQNSKSRSLASNLAQEKMQILKQQSYHRILVTTSTAYRTDFTPSIPYDSGYYPAESILEGGIRYTRLTYIQVARENSGVIQILPPTTPDTGMKLITINVIWRDGTESKHLTLTNVASNPDTVMSNAIIQGRVRNITTTAGIPNAQVVVAENIGWRDTANTSGDYQINLSPGNYNLMASAEGYFTSIISVSIGAGTLTQNFNLTEMASGTIRGAAWMNDHLVISQVVGSTYNATTGFTQEYVEVFNPSTWTWTIALNATTPAIDLKYHQNGNSIRTIAMNYTNLTVAPNRYYLFANTPTVAAGGITRTADAVFSGSNPGYPNLISIDSDPGNDASGVGLAWTGSGTWIDQVGWTTSGNNPPIYEGSPIDQAIGLQDGEQYVRLASTTGAAGIAAGFGRAYDSAHNHRDFIAQRPITYVPRNSSDSAIVVSGTPAYGAVVSATDGLSTPTTAYSVGNPPYAGFVLPAVATGTHFVSIFNGSRLIEIDNIPITASGSQIWIPNATTDPVWPSAGYYAAVLSSVATQGFITGRVTNASNIVISPSILVQAGNTTLPVNSQGYYTIELATGTYTVRANPGNTNSSYVSQDQPGIVVNLGQITSDVNFVLSQGGKLQTRITRDGINPLPGVAVYASDSNGITRDEEVSGSDGRVLLVNLATGTYTVGTVLDSGEISTPETFSPTVTAGNTVFIGTFTISGAYGTITGAATSAGKAIQSGVLIVASTATITTPPTLSTATLTGAPYYLGSSTEDGTYRLDVRGSTSTFYRVYGYYYTFNGTTPVLSSSTVNNVSVIPGQTTSGVNFSW